MKKTGFYIIKDRFFEDSATGIYWMIPLSSRIDKFRKIIEKKEQSGKPCDILHIVKLDDSRESVFLTESSKSPASIAKSNKQWVGTCLYQEGYKPLLINCGAVIRL